jgi:RimJ/RimL family protein N-acetyltransferase
VDEHSESSEGTDGNATTVAERTEFGRDAGHRNLERVGLVALPWVFEDTQSAFLMYWITPEHQGNGYATEATELLLDYLFRECGFHKIAAYVHENNDSSAALLESLGFQREGTLRREVFIDGDWLDQYRYAILADLWLD